MLGNGRKHKRIIVAFVLTITLSQFSIKKIVPVGKIVFFADFTVVSRSSNCIYLRKKKKNKTSEKRKDDCYSHFILLNKTLTICKTLFLADAYLLTIVNYVKQYKAYL